MDWANPLRTLAPTVDADVLLVLARTHVPLTGARAALLAGRSYAQVRAVLHRLVEQGVAEGERHGNAVSYRLNHEHVLTEAIRRLVDAPAEAERRIAAALEQWDVPPHAVARFGSVARREAGAGSDVDLLLVRPSSVSEDDAVWRGQRHELTQQVERWTGNTVQIVELSVEGLAAAVAAGEPLVESLRGEARVLAGPALSELLGVRGGAVA